MSIEKFEHDCDGCKPAMLDVKTGKPVPDDDPFMIAIMEVWGTLSDIEKATFHRVTCLNSREPEDMFAMQSIIAAFAKVSESGKNTGEVTKRRVRVEGEGEGTYVGDVSLFFFRDRSKRHLASGTNPEERPPDTLIAEMKEKGYVLMEDPENPKIVLDNGKVVYGCQVWWDFI